MTHPYDGLTPDCVISCVEAIGLRSDLRLLALNSYENRVYQVGIEDAEPVIDDVMTTGATAWLAALACHLAGAKSVCAQCLASTPAPPTGR